MSKGHLFHISGKKGSGKSTLLGWLSDDGYFTTEVRFHLEEALAAKKIDTRDIPVPFWWTEPMLQLCYEQLNDHTPVFLTGMYHPNELAFFTKGYEVHNIGLVADDSVRHTRILDRKRVKEENLTIEDIRFKDQKRDGSVGHKADINALIRLAEFTFVNNTTLEDFRQEYDEFKRYLNKRYSL